MSSTTIANKDNSLTERTYLTVTNYPRQSGYLLFLTMMYLVVMLCSGVLTHKIVKIGPFYTMAGTLVSPLWFCLSDIITENYGYKTARKIVLFGFICQVTFALACSSLIQLPSPDNINKQLAYVTVLGSMVRTCFSALAAYICGGVINIYFISRWKILLLGKYFWLRNLGASTISEFIFTILAVSLIQFGKMPLSNILSIIVVSYSLKVIYTIVLAFPANILVNYIKKHDGIDVYDHGVDYNPFKFRD